ncbi:hypothetical protein [Gordonia rubripertincta]|uniref:Uncharacterized protein n=1 Tax=Gordonia rubripertincta TaxID=36822 RepID=A0ABT4MVR4_GORRU|nr:hypothetical protein [Gordonia rubripertincta]MCZ4551098.1 hypothetical protein [Gordonia rubripertincta]
MLSRVRLWLTRRSTSSAADFAPPARRDPAGSAYPNSAVVAEYSVTARPSRGPLALKGAVFGAGLYLVAVVGVMAFGWAQPGTASPDAWASRTAIVVAATAGLWCAACRHDPGQDNSAHTFRERVGCILLGTGLMWFVLGILDMHLWGLFHVGAEAGHHVPELHLHDAEPTTTSRHNTLSDWLFHSSGPTLVVLAWTVLPTRTTTPAPERSNPPLLLHTPHAEGHP